MITIVAIGPLTNLALAVSRVLVIGSANVGLVVTVERLLTPGKTVSEGASSS